MTTQETIKKAVDYAKENNIKNIVVATTTGGNLTYLEDEKDLHIVGVTNAYDQGQNQMREEVRKHFEEAGMDIVTAGHALSGAERCFSTYFGGYGPTEIVANTLRMFSQGVKVCVEVSTMALDAGKIPYQEKIVAIAGSGSLLLKAEKVLGKEAIRNGFYGQEINITTYNLCRINMFLHDIEFDKFNIACEDTLTSPQHWDDEPFELIVSNPPYSIKWAGKDDSLLINDPRFAPAGVLAPKGKADMAFIMHSLSWLAANGTAAIVCFPGIMYRGGAEQKIRKYLVENNYVDCIIQLPGNLFFGTSIATCIMVMKKNKTDNDVLFIDATKECIKVTNNNKLTEENIDRIVSVFTKREEVKHLAYVAACEEIAENDYNLSVSTYVEPEDTREKIDIVKLNAEIKEIVVREQVLRDEIDKIIAEIEVDA